MTFRPAEEHEKCYCGNPATMTAVVYESTLTEEKQEIPFCGPMCMARVLYKSKKFSFIQCDICEKHVKIRYDNEVQIEVYREKVVCAKCKFDLIVEHGQPVDDFITGEFTPGLSDLFHSQVLRDVGYKAVFNMRGRPHKQFYKGCKKALTLMEQGHKVLMKDNGTTFTLWYKPTKEEEDNYA